MWLSWLESYSENPKVPGPILSWGTCMGHRFTLVRERNGSNPISLSFPLFLESINIFKKNKENTPINVLNTYYVLDTGDTNVKVVVVW